MREHQDFDPGLAAQALELGDDLDDLEASEASDRGQGRVMRDAVLVRCHQCSNVLPFTEDMIPGSRYERRCPTCGVYVQASVQDDGSVKATCSRRKKLIAAEQRRKAGGGA